MLFRSVLPLMRASWISEKPPMIAVSSTMSKNAPPNLTLILVFEKFMYYVPNKYALLLRSTLRKTFELARHSIRPVWHTTHQMAIHLVTLFAGWGLPCGDFLQNESISRSPSFLRMCQRP